MMQAQTILFTAPGKVEIHNTPLPPLTQGQMLVETICSDISPGTEMLVYRGQFPKGLTDLHDTLSSKLDYPTLAAGRLCPFLRRYCVTQKAVHDQNAGTLYDPETVPCAEYSL